MNMKKTLLFFFTLLFCASIFANPKSEFRATWLTTGFSIDWPKTRGVDAQKKELISKLDVMQKGNMNVVCLQVRSFCDAIYKSSYEPWAECLTGTRGQDPGYDPLAFAIEEAHKRGLELHVWVNPLRATSSGTLPETDLLVQNAGKWLIKYNNSSFKGQIIDPGYPEARKYVIKVLMEIINNYDVDGILMDDYFYAYGGTKTEDAGSRTNNPAIIGQTDHNYNGDKLDDWRRANVDSLICNLSKEIRAVKPWVRFGMGPFGTWSNQNNAAYRYGIKLPEGVRGSDSFQELYCNTVEWVKQGWVDYINPQLYWSTKSKNQPYEKLCKWWAKDVCEYLSNQLPNGQRVHFFPSQAAYQVFDQSMDGYSDGVEEIKRQLTINRNYLSSGYTGSVLFSTSDYLKMYSTLRSSHFNYKALPPAMDWKSKGTLSAPGNFIEKDSVLSWSGSNAERFTVYAYPRGTQWETAKDDPQYLKGVAWGNSFHLKDIGDLNQLTIAVCSYDRYGVEHNAAFFNGTGVYMPKKEIFWELNGGYCEEELPDYVTEDYIIPTPIKPNNEFGGWYKTKAYRGTPVTKLTPGWKGTLYAKWTELDTALPNIYWDYEMEVYDIMGRFVGNELPKSEHGIFIIIQGDNKCKIVL